MKDLMNKIKLILKELDILIKNHQKHYNIISKKDEDYNEDYDFKSILITKGYLNCLKDMYDVISVYNY